MPGASWVCTTPGGKVRVDHLPLEAFERIFDATEVHWFDLTRNPLRYERAGRLLYGECCTHTGSTPEVLTLARFVEVFDAVTDDDLPDTFTDGVPDPKVDGPETTG
jgi:hypothetical protein